MNDGAEFLPLAHVVEALECAHRRADAAQESVRVFRLSVELPVVVEVRGPDTFIRFPQASDPHGNTPLRLRISIGPGDDRQVSVAPPS